MHALQYSLRLRTRKVKPTETAAAIVSEKKTTLAANV